MSLPIYSASLGAELCSPSSVQQPEESTITQDFPGFPTYAEYKRIETVHLANLSSARQDKTLMPQALFDRIWDVLAGVVCEETPKFRLWVHKMFSMGAPPRSAENPSDSDDDSDVALLHKGFVVAVREQLYHILCYAHGTMLHARGDKMTQFIRERYRYVPKKLVKEFVKACPTCASGYRNRMALPMLDDSAPDTQHNIQFLPRFQTPSSPPSAPVISAENRMNIQYLLNVLQQSTACPLPSEVPSKSPARSSSISQQGGYRELPRLRLSSPFASNTAHQHPQSLSSPLDLLVHCGPELSLRSESGPLSTLEVRAETPSWNKEVLPRLVFASNAAHANSPPPSLPLDFLVHCDPDSPDPHSFLSPSSPLRSMHRTHPYKIGSAFPARI